MHKREHDQGLTFHIPRKLSHKQLTGKDMRADLREGSFFVFQVAEGFPTHMRLGIHKQSGAHVVSTYTSSPLF